MNTLKTKRQGTARCNSPYRLYPSTTIEEHMNEKRVVNPILQAAIARHALGQRRLEQIAQAIDRNFSSPNCSDSNGEVANVVDGLYRVAEAIDNLAVILKLK
ncbi:MAG: hypothetical protein WA555_13415 [Candidatus Sulfotelmatobacter sp.]